MPEKVSNEELSQFARLLHYLALPPTIYGQVARNIQTAELKSEGARIVLEKPIRNDLTSVRGQ